jgi:glycerol-3-phosphate acyltransferase PlsY
MASQWLVLLGGYLLGSIPFSFLVARLCGVADVRAVGSGNVGATNVMRAAGRVAGVAAFALDAGKGAAATACALALAAAPPRPALAAVGAVLGHMYPVWLGFRGGKGVATGAGAFLPLVPLASGAALATFALTLALTRYVSLSSIAGALCLALAAWLLGAPASVWRAATGLALLIAWKHRANLQRLLRGTEPRL